MTQEKLTNIFAEVSARIFTDEKRKQAEEAIRAAQKLGNDPYSDLVAKVNVELILERTFLLEVLSKVLEEKN